MTFSIKADSVKNKPASSFVVPFGTTLREISPSRSGSRWLEIPKQARYSASIAKKNELMNKPALTPSGNLLISANTSILALQYAFFYN